MWLQSFEVGGGNVFSIINNLLPSSFCPSPSSSPTAICSWQLSLSGCLFSCVFVSVFILSYLHVNKPQIYFWIVGKYKKVVTSKCVFAETLLCLLSSLFLLVKPSVRQWNLAFWIFHSFTWLSLFGHLSATQGRFQQDNVENSVPFTVPTSESRCG